MNKNRAIHEAMYEYRIRKAETERANTPSISREQLEADVKAFIASGGKIQQIPFGQQSGSWL